MTSTSDGYERLKQEWKKNYKIGDKAICDVCGREIVFLGEYWKHTGEEWRHVAYPAEEKQ